MEWAHPLPSENRPVYSPFQQELIVRIQDIWGSVKESYSPGLLKFEKTAGVLNLGPNHEAAGTQM